MGRKRKRKDKKSRQINNTSDCGNSADTPDALQTSAGSVAAEEQATDAIDLARHDILAQDQQTDTDGDEWETASFQPPSKKRKRLPKKTSARYPAITFSSHSRLNSSIKISDLQDLALYIFGNGTAPQWVSVRHHSEIRKIVVLMVPGLEKGMFNRSINLEEKSVQSIGEGQTSKILGAIDTNDGYCDKFPLQENKKPRKSADWSNPSINEGSSDAKAYLPMMLLEDLLQQPLKPLAGVFPHLWPVSTPGDDKYCRMHSPIHAMLLCPLPKDKEAENTPGPKAPREAQNWQDEPTRITEFVASVDQLQENDYAVHPAHLNSDEEKLLERRRRQVSKSLMVGEWLDSKVSHLTEGEVPDDQLEPGDLTAGREVLAMDCEMCKTSDGALALTRISIVNWDGKVVLDELIKPELPIVDYLTAYSGITQAILEPIQTTLGNIQSRLLEMLHPKTILVGHSLNVDLAAIRISHPFIIDTSIIYPHPRGPPLKSSLKWLTKKYLGRDIQTGHGTSGHNSIEDAKACLDLVKQKCERGPVWGTGHAATESLFKRIGRLTRPVKHMDGASAPTGRVGAVVDWGHPAKGAGASAKYHIGCQNDDDVVEGIKVATLGSDDGEFIPGGGVDFVWARMRAIEFLQGWRTAVDVTHSSGATQNQTESEDLSGAVAKLVNQISTIYDNLPPCTAFVVYSGSGDPREMVRMQALRQQHRKEYQTEKWDQLTVKWTDVEEQQLRVATRKAREGFAMITVK